MTSLTDRARSVLAAQQHADAVAEWERLHRYVDSRWRDLARAAAELAEMLGVDPAQITATDDPDRRYYSHPYGRVPGMLLVFTDPDQPTGPDAIPATPTAAHPTGSDASGDASADASRSAGARFEFIRDLAGHVYLLGRCPHCTAAVPTSRITELGRALSPHPAPRPRAMSWDPHHVPGCRHRLLDVMTPTADGTTALPPGPAPTPQPGATVSLGPDVSARCGEA